jgi:hypothetical protein
MRRLAALLLLALAPACSEPVTYSYFLVQARLDPLTVDSSIRDRIVACAVIAKAPMREESTDMRCRQRMVMSELGVFEYSTSLTSGPVTFRLIATDLHGQLMAEGETPPLDILVGKTVNAEVVAKLAPGARPTDDGGVAPAPDAGTSD